MEEHTRQDSLLEEGISSRGVNANNASAEAGQTAVGGKYLTFMLGGEQYGVHIGHVREIIGAMGVTITAVPGLATDIKGVLNLRGMVISIIDLRSKFMMEEKAHDRETCVIILQLGQRPVGAVVDAVSDVVDIGGGSICAPPEIGGELNGHCILGFGKVKNRVVVLLNAGAIATVTETVKEGAANA